MLSDIDANGWLDIQVISILHCVQASSQMVMEPDGSNVLFTIPHISLLMSFNILITLLSFTRLVNLRQRAKRYSFSKEIKNIYMSYEALVVESALPPAIFSLAFFILYGLDNPGAVLVFALLIQSTVSARICRIKWRAFLNSWMQGYNCRDDCYQDCLRRSLVLRHGWSAIAHTPSREIPRKFQG